MWRYSALCFLVQSCRLQMSMYLLLKNNPVLELQLSSAELIGSMIDSWRYNLRYNNNPNQNFSCESYWCKNNCLCGFCLQSFICVPAYQGVQSCACTRVCVHMSMWCLSLPDRSFIGLMMFNVIWHPIALASSAFTHDTNNSSTPCESSPVTQSARIHSCTSMKKLTTESTESWKQPLVASFCRWVCWGPQRCEPVCHSAAKGDQNFVLPFPLAAS